MKKERILLLLPVALSLASCGGDGSSTGPWIDVGDGTNEEEVLRLQEMVRSQDGISAAESRGRVRIEATTGTEEGLIEIIYDTIEGIPSYLHSVDPISGEALLVPQVPGETFDWSCWEIFLREPGEEGSVEGLLNKEDAEKFLEESGAKETLSALVDPVEAGLVLVDIPEALYPYVGLEFPEAGGYVFRLNTAGLEDAEAEAVEVVVDGQGLVLSARMGNQAIEADWGVTFGTTNRLEGATLEGPLSTDLAEGIISYGSISSADPEGKEISATFEGEDEDLPPFLRGLSSLKLDGQWDPQHGRHGVYCEAHLKDGSSWLLYQDDEDVDLGHYMHSDGTKVEISMAQSGYTYDPYKDDRMNDFDRWVNTILRWIESPYEGCGTPWFDDDLLVDMMQGELVRAWYDGTPEQVKTRAWCSLEMRSGYLQAYYDFTSDWGGFEEYFDEEAIFEREARYDWEGTGLLTEETVWKSEETGWLLEEDSRYPEDGKVARISWDFSGFSRKTSL